MNILVISASMRAESQTLKVANWLSNYVIQTGAESSVLDLHSFKLPLFDDGETVTDNASLLTDMLNVADGYVFISPEWNGMMSHGLINMLHFAEHELAYKPVMLVGVSAGRGGTHPVDQMRLMGHKNRHYIISPENLIISGVENALNDTDMTEQSLDLQIKMRAKYSVAVLMELAKSLQSVRSSGVVDLDTYSNGV